MRPEHLPPEIPAHLAAIWAGFWDLDSCRMVGMAPGRIPYTAMLAWLDEHGVSGPDLRRWHVELWQALDAELLREAAKHSRPEPTESAGPARPGSRVTRR